MRRRRHVVSRNVAIGLGVLCVILFLALVWTVNYYTNTSEIASLQSQIDSLNSIIALQKSDIIADASTISIQAGRLTGTNFTIYYAGYVIVNVLYCSTSNITVALEYTSYAGEYFQMYSVDSGGTARFPVLPASITVWVGNTNSLYGATAMVEMLYYY
jgi:hypothetical protein